MTDAGAVERVAPGVVVVLSGHTAMVSFTDHRGRVELETIEREFPDLLPALVDHDGVGFLLVRSAELGPIVFGRDGALRLADGTVTGQDPLAGYGPHAAALIRRFDGFPNCPDIVINSRYDPATDDATPFEPHVGTHGGLGGPQSRGFLIHPAELPTPGGDRRRRAPAPGAARLADPPRPPRARRRPRPVADPTTRTADAWPLHLIRALAHRPGCRAARPARDGPAPGTGGRAGRPVPTRAAHRPQRVQQVSL